MRAPAAVALAGLVACGASHGTARAPIAVSQVPPAPAPVLEPAPPSGSALDVIGLSNARRLERLNLALDLVQDVQLVADGTLVVTWSRDLELVAPDGTTRARIPYAAQLDGMAWHDKPAWRGTDAHEPNVEIAVLAREDDARYVDIYGTDGARHSRVDAPGVRVIDHVARGRLAFGSEHAKVQVWDRAARAFVGEVDVSRPHAWASDGRVLVAAGESDNVELVDFRGAPPNGPTRSSFRWEGDVPADGAFTADAVSIAPDGNTAAVLAGETVTVVDVPSKRRAVHASVRLFDDGGWDRAGKLALRGRGQLWLVDRANPKLVEKKTAPQRALGLEGIRWGSDGAPTVIGSLYPNTLVVWSAAREARAGSVDGDRNLHPRLFADARHVLRFDRGRWQVFEAAGAPWPVLLSGHAEALAVSPVGARLATRALGQWRLYDADEKREVARSPRPSFRTASGRAIPFSDLSDDLLDVLSGSQREEGTITQWSFVAARAGRYALRGNMYAQGAVDVVDLRNAEVLWSGIADGGTLDQFAVDPSGDRFAAVEYTAEPQVRVWTKGREAAVFPKATPAAAVAFAGRHVIATTYASTMGWDGTNAPWVTTCYPDHDVRILVGDGGTRVTVGDGYRYCVLEASTGKILARIELGPAAEYGPYRSDDGTELFVHEKDGVRRWRMSDGTELSPLVFARPKATKRGLVHAANEILAVTAEGFVVVFDRASGQERGRFPSKGAIALDVSKSGVVATLAPDGTGTLFDRQGKRLATFACPKATAVWFASDDRAVACRPGTESIDDVFVVPR